MFFLIVLYFSYLIIKPYVLAIVVSFILAYFLYPIHKVIKKYVKHSAISVIVLMIFSFVILAGMTYFTANPLIDESVKLYQNVREINIESVAKPLNEFFGNNVDVNAHLKNAMGSILGFVVEQLSDFAFRLPQYILIIFVTLFILYYLLKDEQEIAEAIKRSLPFRQKEKTILFDRIQSVFKATVYGTVLTALAQGLLGTIGLFIFGAPSPFFFGAMITLASTLPYFGASLIWFPLGVYMISIGQVYAGIGFMIYGLLIISTVDNLIRPYIISRKTQLHPVISLLGVLGGVTLFGFVGVIIGPLILALCITVAEFYVNDYET